MEQNLGEVQEDRLSGFGVGEGCLGVACKVCDTHERAAQCAEHGQDHPADADAAAGLSVRGGAHRHESHDNVRLAEVAQTPREGRNDTGEGGACEDAQCVGAYLADGLNHRAHAAEVNNGDDGNGNECCEHEQALNHVGVGCAHEAAEEGVEHGDACQQEHTGVVFLSEGGLEEQAAGHHAGGDVEGEEHQNHDAGDDAQHALGVMEAVAQEDGDGHGVACYFGVATQSRCHELPVAPCADGQTDGEPCLGEAAEVDGAGQTHEEPTGHIGGAR